MDPLLIVPPEFFPVVCIPFRAGVGKALVLFPEIFSSAAMQIISCVLGLAAIGLLRKWWLLGNCSWKMYWRSVPAAAAAAGLALFAAQTESEKYSLFAKRAAGLIMVADAAAGLFCYLQWKRCGSLGCTN